MAGVKSARKILITDIKEIKTIKISCGKRGLAVELPVTNRAFIDISMCRNCGVEFPVKSVQVLLESVYAVQNTLKPVSLDSNWFPDVSVTIEPEEK